MNETRLDESISNAEVDIQGYTSGERIDVDMMVV